MQVITRQAALAIHQLRYFTGIPCGRGHVAERYVRSGSCLACARVRQTDDPKLYAPIFRPLPQTNKLTDWNYLTPKQIADWYMAIDTIRRGLKPHSRTKPLKERELIWAIPPKVLIEA